MKTNSILLSSIVSQQINMLFEEHSLAHLIHSKRTTHFYETNTLPILQKVPYRLSATQRSIPGLNYAQQERNTVPLIIPNGEQMQQEYSPAQLSIFGNNYSQQVACATQLSGKDSAKQEATAWQLSLIDSTLTKQELTARQLSLIDKAHAKQERFLQFDERTRIRLLQGRAPPCSKTIYNSSPRLKTL